MGFDPKGLRVLLTGGSSGIGAAMAERLAAAGAVVGITARDEGRLGAVLERCRAHVPECRSWSLDLADPGQVDELARGVLDELGGVDVLINNAGVPKRKQVALLDAATMDAITRINYLAPVQLTLALLPHMLTRGSGRIVNVSSVAATLSSPGEAAYDGSKAALAVFSEAMAIDLWDKGIKVLVVYPGVVDTPLFEVPDNDPMTDEIGRISVDDLVDGVLGALDQDAVEVYVPEWFKGVAVEKAKNVGAFLAGTAEWVRSHQET
ncbi:MAG: SDR family NAD(P)-dependent oxidoreductase [Acidimicrobiales bacterium]